MRLDIKALAVGVIEEYSTNNPFEIAEKLNIVILYHELPDKLKGYRIDNLVILNKKLTYKEKKWVLAHELGHYFIHDYISIGNCFKNELLIKEKYERQADIFASELLLTDIDKYCIEGLTDKQIASMLNVPLKLVKYKVYDERSSNYECSNL